MVVNKLNIINFKNIADLSLDFCSRFNCIVGDNGVGKTNVLDALYYLSMCKSFFNLPESQNVRHGEPFFLLQAAYTISGESVDISCGYKQGEKKVMKRNGKAYTKLSEHIGELPLVMISPEDNILIDGGSIERRRLADSIICQCDHAYMQHLMAYNKILLQRNTLLKNQGRAIVGSEMLEVWDEQLALHNEAILNRRQEFVREFLPEFCSYYNQLSSGLETVDIIYQVSQKDKPLLEALKQNAEKDAMLGYTSVGIHRDDLILNIDGYPVRKIGSQGQKKSFLIALKLAQYKWMQNRKDIKPLLLLDDIFDRLDAKRVASLLQIVSDTTFGQIFITDTNSRHIDTLLSGITTDYSLFQMQNGELLQR